MTDYNKCCSEDMSRLEYPSFSVVFIQTFSIYHQQEFTLPVSMMGDMNPSSRKGKEGVPQTADDCNQPILPMDRGLEDEIFVLPPVKDSRHWWDRHVSFSPDTLYRFTMRGFDFEMPIVPDKDDKFPPVMFSGHAYVDMVLFFSHTVSITYRFCFDGKKCMVNDLDGNECAALTDHVISFLSTHLSAECWSPDKRSGNNKPAGGSKLNLQTSLTVNNIHFDKDGCFLPDKTDYIDLTGDGRAFDSVALRYKKFIYSLCRYKSATTYMDRLKHMLHVRANEMTVNNDSHYAMVDIWEDIRHRADKGDSHDYFAKETEISEKAVIDHIYEYHKPELVGLMTLYPNEWIYRDPDSYDEVCGEDIAIDTDDLVLAGTNVSLVIGTYGRREKPEEKVENKGDQKEDAQNEDVLKEVSEDQKQRTDWGKHLREMRMVYHVSWQEYMMILQMVLAKKHVIGLAKEQLVRVALTSRNMSSSELIRQNAEMGIRLSRMTIQLDLLKYSKFASHKVMFDRTTRRLKLDHDAKELKDIMEMIDGSLNNLANYKSVRTDYFLNIVLAVISVVSALGLLFQKVELPLLNKYEGILKINDEAVAHFVLLGIASVVVLSLAFIIYWTLHKIWLRLRNR